MNIDSLLCIFVVLGNIPFNSKILYYGTRGVADNKMMRVYIIQCRT